jgi:Starch-binding associating with outer membrane
MKKSLFVLFAGLVVLGGCKKVLDINQNPNQPTAVTPNVVLSSALVTTGASMAGFFPFTPNQNIENLNCWVGYWARSGNYQPDVQTETYNIAHDYTDVFWTSMYTNLNDYDYIEKAGESLKTPFYAGVAKTMKAFNFSILVDVYNDIPYSDAFKVSTHVTTKYDKAQDIYTDLIKQLDSAIFYFEDAKNSFYPVAPSLTLTTDDKYDIIFGSARIPLKVSGATDFTDRMTEWEKFANTLELKLLIHQSQVSGQQAFVLSQIQKILANGFGFLGAGESAAVNPGYQASTGKQNPFYGEFYSSIGTPTSTSQNYYRANAYAVNFYLSTNDNRGFLFYAPVGNTIVGNFEGDPKALTNTATSAIGTGILKGNNQDELLLSDFESLFLQAEAAQRGWIPGSSQTFYQQAITQSYVYLYIGNSGLVGTDPTGDAKIYYTSGINDVDWTTSANKLEAIITQKWASLNGINWIEAWTDFRRTGIPNLPITAAPTHLVPQIPVRYLYPQLEYNTNGTNVPQLPANAQFTSKIFWNQ